MKAGWNAFAAPRFDVKTQIDDTVDRKRPEFRLGAREHQIDRKLKQDLAERLPQRAETR